MREYELHRNAINLLSEYIFNGIIKPNENIVISYINDDRYTRFLTTRSKEYINCSFENGFMSRYDEIYNFEYKNKNLILKSLCRQKGINYLFDMINQYLTYQIKFYDNGQDYDLLADYDAHVFLTSNIKSTLPLKLKSYENLVGISYDKRREMIINEQNLKYGWSLKYKPDS